MNYIVTKPIKSKGIAALLVMLFGGIGLFYATTLGGIIMGLIAPVAIIAFFFLGLYTGQMSVVVIVILFCCFYYILCLIWALAAVGNYNKKIIAESDNGFSTNTTSTIVYSGKKENKPDIWIWILFFFLLSSVLFLLYYKGIIFNNSNTKDEISAIKPSSKDSSNKNLESRIYKLKNKEKATYSNSKKISRNIFKKDQQYAWKVTSYHFKNPDNTDSPIVTEKEDRYFIFYDNKIYMILNGYLMKTWHETKNHYEDELSITETKEGDVFSVFGSIQIDYKSGESTTYECDQIPIKNVAINKEYLQ